MTPVTTVKIVLVTGADLDNPASIRTSPPSMEAPAN